MRMDETTITERAIAIAYLLLIKIFFNDYSTLPHVELIGLQKNLLLHIIADEMD